MIRGLLTILTAFFFVLYVETLSDLVRLEETAKLQADVIISQEIVIEEQEHLLSEVNKYINNK